MGVDGRWHGWVPMGRGSATARNRRHVSGKTRTIVLAKVRDLERQRDANGVGSFEQMTVAAWLEYWVGNIAPVRVRPRTLESYESVVRRHIVPEIGGRSLEALRAEHVEQLYATLLSKGLAPSSVLRVHCILARALRVAAQRQHVQHDVTRFVDRPARRSSRVARPLTLDEARRVLSTATGGRNAARWVVALALGLRQSEALALRWSDIDFERHSMTIQRTVHRVKGRGLVYDEPKTEGSRRTVALPIQLTTALRVHLSAQRRERSAAGDSWDDHDLVFTQANGRPIDKRADYEAWCRLLAAAEVERVRLHDARHTAATILLAEGVHPRVVMELLGHSQMRTTTDIYSHVFPAVARDAADRMGAALLADIDGGSRRTHVGDRAIGEEVAG